MSDSLDRIPFKSDKAEGISLGFAFCSRELTIVGATARPTTASVVGVLGNAGESRNHVCTKDSTMARTLGNGKRSAPRDVCPALPGFVPLSHLWDGDGAMYRSEAAARWAIRTLRLQLADANAMAVRGRDLYYHPERVAGVIGRDALERFRRRAGAVQA